MTKARLFLCFSIYFIERFFVDISEYNHSIIYISFVLIIYIYIIFALPLNFDFYFFFCHCSIRNNKSSTNINRINIDTTKNSFSLSSLANSPLLVHRPLFDCSLSRFRLTTHCPSSANEHSPHFSFYHCYVTGSKKYRCNFAYCSTFNGKNVDQNVTIDI